MNWQHLQTFLWLRWRLLVNQLRRGGAANVVFLAILAVGGVGLAVGLFLTFLLVGLFALADASPQVLLYVWDGLVVAFLFFWGMGLLVELQRSEVLSLDKFLHLPVSLRGAFLINYVGSFLSVALLLFLPAMVALCLALVVVKGPALLLLFPLLAAFLLMVTALTYQFRGWLASLMVNKRRRRTVIVLVTAAFVLSCQLPNLLNVMRPWQGQRQDDLSARLQGQQVELQRALAVGEIDQAQYQQRSAALVRDYQEQRDESDQETERQLERGARLVNEVLPPGWLPLGAAAVAEGRVLLPLLCILGMALIGTASLWRAYRTTVRLYTGQFGSGKAKPVAAPPAGAKPVKPSGRLLEMHLPGLSEQAAAIALGGFRSLLRAPEAKMMLLSPVILLVIFGSMFLTHSAARVPEMVRPLMATGGMTMILLTMVQLIGNQFGFDRGGFRVFVLSAAPRRDILLGKNLALAPLALGMAVVVLAVVEAFCPMRLDHLLAVLPQLASTYLVFCLLANCLSILAPMPIRSGSLKAVNPRVIPVLLHMAFVFLSPLALVPALLPMGVEFLVGELTDVKGWPIDLVLSVLELVAIVYLYRLVLPWEGDLLQAREQKILEIVTTKVD